jgi:hypothetical protein
MQRGLAMNIFMKPRVMILAFMSLLLIFTWANEVFDLLYLLLGASKTPINWRESILETVVITMGGFGFDRMAKRCISRLKKQQEGLNTICSFCHAVRMHDQWIPLESWLTWNSEAELSHGLCQSCLRKEYPHLYKQMVHDRHFIIK